MEEDESDAMLIKTCHSTPWMTTPVPSHEPVAARPLGQSQQPCWFWLLPRLDVFPTASADHQPSAFPEPPLHERRRPNRVFWIS
jgi:hypothetical protein